MQKSQYLGTLATLQFIYCTFWALDDRHSIRSLHKRKLQLETKMNRPQVGTLSPRYLLLAYGLYWPHLFGVMSLKTITLKVIGSVALL